MHSLPPPMYTIYIYNTYICVYCVYVIHRRGQRLYSIPHAFRMDIYGIFGDCMGARLQQIFAYENTHTCMHVNGDNNKRFHQAVRRTIIHERVYHSVNTTQAIHTVHIEIYSQSQWQVAKYIALPDASLSSLQVSSPPFPFMPMLWTWTSATFSIEIRIPKDIICTMMLLLLPLDDDGALTMIWHSEFCIEWTMMSTLWECGLLINLYAAFAPHMVLLYVYYVESSIEHTEPRIQFILNYTLEQCSMSDGHTEHCQCTIPRAPFSFSPKI